ncbi:YdeI/OmpD-associated family protein [Pseudotamlana carrageenivorans]|uniref:YdeI/OmpD-associated family protein n=1 Tax=Pseudotamlana carrageenivorans TaxID=2069432 RepID=UPI00268958AF
MQESGFKAIEIAKESGACTVMDDVQNGVIPKELQDAFNKNPQAYKNYKNFAKGYQKSYLFYLESAKREATKKKRINKIIELCEANKKMR